MKALSCSVISLLIVIPTFSAQGADKGESCKTSPRIVERCRWVTGQVTMSMRGVFYLSPEGQERSFVLDDETMDKTLACPGPAGVDGEFEFCRFADRDVPENRPDILQNRGYVEYWGCISAWRNAKPSVPPAWACPPL